MHIVGSLTIDTMVLRRSTSVAGQAVLILEVEEDTLACVSVRPRGEGRKKMEDCGQ